MAKEKLLFVDHAFHSVTKSSVFCLDFLKPHFDVEVFNVAPGSKLDHNLIAKAKQNKYIFIWQMDYLAPIFLALGLRTIVVPLYDGSGNLPNGHWIASSQARFVNFSKTLHDHICLLKCESLLVRYFPKPANESELPDYKNLRCFLWQRRPESGINVSMVERLLGNQIDSLHVHDARDIPDEKPKNKTYSSAHFSVTTSRWFSTFSEYNEVLKKANIYIAPRPSEGIGMGFLEAMARGMLVLANDEPTHTEYISNWINGILINKNNPSYVALDTGTARNIGRMAWKTVVTGYEQWQASIPSIVKYVLEIPEPKRRDDVDILAFANELNEAFISGIDNYTHYLSGNYPADDKLLNIQTTFLTNNFRFSMRIINAVSALTDLLTYYDEDFIVCAYKTLLNRTPEIDGKHYYLTRLRAGVSRIEILDQIASSREAIRANKVASITGLHEALKKFRLLRLPVIGSVLQFFGIRSQENDLNSRLRAIENQNYIIYNLLSGRRQDDF